MPGPDLFLYRRGGRGQAWTVSQGTPVRKAAGKIHSDMERGFIRAEVFPFHDLERLGTPLKVKEAGLMRLEGRIISSRTGISSISALMFKAVFPWEAAYNPGGKDAHIVPP